MVLDNMGAVGLVYASKGAYYELPGGGLQDGESNETGLHRELLEELGCKVKIIKPIGIVEEHRSYIEMKQISYCYLAILKGNKGLPTYSEDELNAGFKVHWAKSIDEALSLLEKGIDEISDYGLKFMRLRDLHILRTAKGHL